MLFVRAAGRKRAVRVQEARRIYGSMAPLLIDVATVGAARVASRDHEVAHESLHIGRRVLERIARAVVEYLHNTVEARTLFATHYHELAAMAEELPHLLVQTMAISDDGEGEIVFLHRVVSGSLGRSYGVHVARLAGMPPAIVRRADEILQRLEAGRETIQQILLPEKGSAFSLAEHNADSYMLSPRNGYSWQSSEGLAIGQVLDQQREDLAQLLDEIDVCAITPLDALNLLFALQKQRKASLQALRNAPLAARDNHD